jgi:hypothetical protein
VNVHTWHLSIGIGEKQNDLKKAFKEREKFDGAAIKEQLASTFGSLKLISYI